MKWNEIKTWEKKDGWYIGPEPKPMCAKIGDGVEISDWVEISDRVEIGYGAKIGDGVEIGDWANIGDLVNIGDWVKIGDRVTLPIFCSATFPIHWHSPGHIRYEYIVKPFDWWTENITLCAKAHKYTLAEQNQYELFVAQIIKWEKVMGNKLGWAKER